MKIIGTIPARLGSKRVKQKNLRHMKGKPLICYAIEAARNSKTLTDVYVNTESDLIGEIAEKNGVYYYKRKVELAQDSVTSDEFNYDFMKNIASDIVVMVNPVAPLIKSKDIDKMVTYYLENDFDTLIPIREERLHTFCSNKIVNFKENTPVQTFCDSKPVNFDINNKLPMTQDLTPIQICAWTVCIWRTNVFIKSFEKNGHGVFSGKVGLYKFPKNRSLKVSTIDDFNLAEIIIKGKSI